MPQYVNFEDRTLECIDCRDAFLFSAGEQKFYDERNLSEPKRCPACREKKKKRIEREGRS